MDRERHPLNTADAVRAYVASDSIEARSLAAYLDEAGVEAYVLGEALQGGYGGINVGSMNSVEVWVKGSQGEEAESLVAAWRQEVATATAAESEHGERHRNGKRSTFQYSVGTALVVMTMLAIVAALLGRGVIKWYEAPSSLLGALYLVIYVALMVKYVRYLRGDNN